MASHHHLLSHAQEQVGCINGPRECAGDVEMRWPGEGERLWPRCARHNAERMARANANRGRYYDSPVAPVDFDPSYAGESWDED